MVKRIGVAAILVHALLGSGEIAVADRSLVLDPGATRIRFFLPATLHTVAGSAALSRGEIRFDLDRAFASGEVRIDARSATTGIGARDATMHREVLESERFPEIVFRAEKVFMRGAGSGGQQIAVEGSLEIHGSHHPIVIPIEAALQGTRARLRSRFVIPYVQWGMKDVSTFVLRVSKTVEVVVEAIGTLDRPLGGPDQ